MKIIIMCLIVLCGGCVSNASMLSRYETHEVKHVSHIYACTKNRCYVQFEDNTLSYVKLPVVIGDKIVFVWSKVASMWLQVWN